MTASAFTFITLAGFCAGFVDAVAGGGGLISLPAVLALGLSPVTALGTNKVIGISTALASTLRYRRSNVMRLRDSAFLWFVALFLGAFGAFCATKTRPDLLRPILLCGLVAVALFTILRRDLGTIPHDGGPKIQRKTLGWFIVLAVGFYDGFFGPGTGTFLMLAFVWLWGSSWLEASARGRMINLATNLGALSMFAWKGEVALGLVLPGAVASFIGGLAGAQWAVRKGASGIRPVFVAMTWLLIAKVAWDLVRA